MLTLLLALAITTKPCPPPACEGLGDTACAKKATWVAVGRITKVIHHPQGEPLFKDFAEFVFEPSRWEKKPEGALPAAILFRVGWCHNMRTVPDDVSGELRFFGEGSATMEPRYLDFRKANK